MKKIVSLILVLTLAVGMVLTLASCNMLMGTYSNDTLNTSYKFMGNKVTKTVEVTILGTTTKTETEGTYKIAENASGDLTISFDWDDDDDDKDDDDDTDVSVSFEKGDDYIKIWGVKYTKQ